MKAEGMEWSTNHPLSGRDLWINTPKYRNLKGIKIEASIAIAIQIAEEDYQTAEDIAMAWIDNDTILNKSGKASMVKPFLTERWKFIRQTTACG
jgi:hypothetical protein